MNSHERASTVGDRIIRSSWASSVVFTATAVAAAISPGVLRWPALIIALAMFAFGCVIFVWAFAFAVGRSRTAAIGIGGLFFLAGSAPRRVQVNLMGSFALQVVVAISTASARLFSTLAFGSLAPVMGLALAGLWGAKFGTFGPRSMAE